MANIKNVICTNSLGDGVTIFFGAAGIVSTDPSYCVVTINGLVQVAGSDYVVDPSFRIKFNAPPTMGATVIISVFEVSGYNLSATSKDNVTTITRTALVTDGVQLSYTARGPIALSADNYIVTVGGRILQNSTDYTILNNIITFTAIPPRGLILQILVISASLYDTPRGGVSPKDILTLSTRTTTVADGIRDTYIITGSTSNKSVYTLVFVNGLMYEGGIDYIVSLNRVKFIRKPAAGSLLDFVAFGAAPSPMIPPAMERVRYLSKDANLNERTLYRNWWREQISHYGTTANYYTNLTNRGNVDYIYGEAPLAGYSEPEELNVAVKVDSETSSFSRWGLITDTDSTVYIHHDDFQEIFGDRSEPKIGDLIEFTEIGIDRLNYPDRGPRLMEITEKVDEVPGEINNLAGHYVWFLKLKRFDYSRESSILPELGTKDPAETGETVPGIPNPIDELSKQIFNYDQNPCSNDNVYGDY